MSKCSSCRKLSKELDSTWDRVRTWLFNFLFKQDIIDLSQDKFTQGYGDGYKAGWNRLQELRDVKPKE